MTPAFHKRALLGTDQTTIKKTSHPTALCCVAQYIMDIMVSFCFFFQCENEEEFSLKRQDNKDGVMEAWTEVFFYFYSTYIFFI